jgi:putative flippase GtrA
MKKLKELIQKKKQLILYLSFGFLTTVVSLLAWYLTLKLGVKIWHDEVGAPTAFLDVLGSTTQWVTGVLFAFVTNKLWVFTEADRGIRVTMRQLAVFSGSRVLTYFLEVGINLGMIALLEALHCPVFIISVGFADFTVDARLWAKILSSVAVVISNYFISKLFVFRKKKVPVECEESEK